MNRIGYNNIMQKIIDDGIKNNIHEGTPDNILKDFRNFQELLYKTLKIMKIMTI